MPNFWGDKPLGEIHVMESDQVPQGTQVLCQDGIAVWVGKIGAPIEDAIFDGVVLSPHDYARLKAATS